MNAGARRALGLCVVALAEQGRFRHLIYWLLAGCVVAMLSFHALQSGGVSSARILADGRGERDPIASNETDSGRAQNRRVEVYISAFQG